MIGRHVETAVEILLLWHSSELFPTPPSQMATPPTCDHAGGLGAWQPSNNIAGAVGLQQTTSRRQHGLAGQGDVHRDSSLLLHRACRMSPAQALAPPRGRPHAAGSAGRPGVSTRHAEAAAVRSPGRAATAPPRASGQSGAHRTQLLSCRHAAALPAPARQPGLVQTGPGRLQPSAPPAPCLLGRWPPE